MFRCPAWSPDVGGQARPTGWGAVKRVEWKDGRGAQWGQGGSLGKARPPAGLGRWARGQEERGGPPPTQPCTPARRKGLLTTATSEQGAVGCKRERDKGGQWGEAGGQAAVWRGDRGLLARQATLGHMHPSFPSGTQSPPASAVQRGGAHRLWGHRPLVTGTQPGEGLPGREVRAMNQGGEPRGPQCPPMRFRPHPGPVQGGPGPWDWNQMEQMGDLSHRASVFLYVKWEDRPPYRLGVKVKEETGLSPAPPAPGPPPLTGAGLPAALSVTPCLAGCPLWPPHGAE